MSIAFLCAASHTPGITAWPDAAGADLKDRFYSGYDDLRRRLEASEPDVVLMITTEHFANFFLDSMPAFTIGQGDSHFGPVEPWVNISQGVTPGEPELAERLLEAAFMAGFELNYSHELKLDHGTMIPLSFLNPDRTLRVVPFIINAMTYPMPAPSRCYELGRVLGQALEADSLRVAVVATGGLSHAPGERAHGDIDTEFDENFIARLMSGDAERITDYTDDELEARGLGTHEIRTWMALAGIAQQRSASLLFYEPIKGWATGCGLLYYQDTNR